MNFKAGKDKLRDFSSREDWENPLIFQRNKEKAHAEALSWDSLEEAARGGSSPWKLLLDGIWDFCWVPNPSERPEGFQETDYSAEGWDKIRVPGVLELQGYGTPYYLAFRYPPALSVRKKLIPQIDPRDNPVGSYRREFILPEGWLSMQVFLHLGAVKSAARVWMNGLPVGYSQGSNTPAEFDVTETLKPGKNLLAVEVYRYSDGTYLEDQDMWFLSGIFRSVYLYAEPPLFIRDFFFKTDLSRNGEVLLFWQVFLNREKDTAAQGGALKIVISGPIGFPESAGNTSKWSMSPRSPLDFPESAGKTVNQGAEGAKIAPDFPVVAEAAYPFEAPIPGEYPLSGSIPLKDPELWSAENPVLYRICIHLLGRDGQTLSVKTLNYGLRTLEIRGTEFHVNGKKVFLRGVNRHDFHPDTGWTLPPGFREEEIRIMKRHNINALRTSHYPNDPQLYELCDRYGIYVMDEADLETHGVRRKGIPGDDPLWTAAVVDRMERMVLRDRNHPSVVIWSLGNEAGFGDNFRKMKSAALNLDDSRPFHYEGDRDLSVSDFFSVMYPTPETDRKIAEKQDLSITAMDNLLNRLAADNKAFKRDQYAGKPVVACEFAHAMENSLGNFAEHLSIYLASDNWAGCFIWDFADQAIRKKLSDLEPLPGGGYRIRKALFPGNPGSTSALEGEDRTAWLYGGDFGEERTDGHFCVNGIVAADRTLHPSIWEVKRGYQPLQAELIDPARGEILIKNLYSFGKLTDLILHWEITGGGFPLLSGTVKEIETEPGGSRRFFLPFLDLGSATAGEPEHGGRMFATGRPGFETPEGLEPRSGLSSKGQTDFEAPEEHRSCGGIFTTGRPGFETPEAYIPSSGQVANGRPDSLPTAEPAGNKAPAKNSGKEIPPEMAGLLEAWRHEYILTLRFLLKKTLPWAEAGHEVAFEQFPLEGEIDGILQDRFKENPVGRAADLFVPPAEGDPPLTMIRRKEGKLSITVSSLSLTLSLKRGTIESLAAGKQMLFLAPLAFNFFRAPTDNDLGFANFKPFLRAFLPGGSWRRCGRIQILTRSIRKTGEDLEVIFTYRNRKGRGKVLYRIGLCKEGWPRIAVENSYRPERDMIRFGMQTRIPREFETAAWYGRGPEENYRDRNQGARVGIHSRATEKLIHHYMRPQENGNRTDTRWLFMDSKAGFSLLIRSLGPEPFNFSLWPCTQEDLEQSKHIHELPERDFFTLNIDYGQRGVGGDKPGNLSLLEKYKLRKGREYSYSFEMIFHEGSLGKNS